MNYFSICAIFKHEERYIGDWVKYHLGIGAEHIYLYDNESPDNSAGVAKSIGKSKVTIQTIIGSPVQHVAYARCLADYKFKSRWIAFIDIDEFIVTATPIHNLLRYYEAYPCLCPHWVLFGSNNHLEYAPISVPERFTKCQADVNPHVKSIVNPIRTGNWVTPHRFTHDINPVDENCKPIEMEDSIPPNGTIDKIYIAHYATKSKGECFERRARLRADTGTLRNAQEFFDTHDRNERTNMDVFKIWRTL